MKELGAVGTTGSSVVLDGVDHICGHERRVWMKTSVGMVHLVDEGVEGVHVVDHLLVAVVVTSSSPAERPGCRVPEGHEQGDARDHERLPARGFSGGPLHREAVAVRSIASKTT